MRLIPIALVVASAIILVAGGCGKGLFPEVSASSSGTVTPTPVASAFLYATNFNDGLVSAFGRNTNTGALSFISQQSAGAVNGPMGVAVTANDDLVFVANASDGNVYEYSIVLSGGTPGSLTSLGSIASGTAPQMIAIDDTDNFVYVTNATSKTVSQFVINSDSTLSSLGPSISGFSGKPFGITAHPSQPFVYVSDNTAGLLYTFSIASNGLLTQVGFAVNSNGLSPGQPGLMAIAFDGTQGYLFVDDTTFGVVSVFLIQSNGALAYSSTFGVSQSKTIGIGAINNGGGSGKNYVLTANMTANFVQPYIRTGAILTQQTSVATAGNPTGLVIDPSGSFAYTGNSGTGTIGLLGINNQCRAQPICLIKTFASESPANSNAGTQFVATTH